jgi:hypothetical protein
MHRTSSQGSEERKMMTNQVKEKKFVTIEPTNEEKEKVFLALIPYSLGHHYIGFEGKRCSRIDTDKIEQAMEECSWVYDVRKKVWAKRPA